MILWLDGAHDPRENMRRDEALLAAAEAGAEPVLRLFSFAPHGITLGLNQSPERELDLARCEADGVPWAVRPTGGRAIFHAEEWTYSLATPLADPTWGGSRSATYTRIAELLVAGLMRLGVPADPHGAGHVTLAPRLWGGASVAPRRAARVVGGRSSSARNGAPRALLQQGALRSARGHRARRLSCVRPADSPGGRRGLAGKRLPHFGGRPRRLSCNHETRESLRLASASAGRFLGIDPPLARWADALAAELGPGVRRIEGALGAFLLTLSKRDSYTSAAFEACS